MRILMITTQTEKDILIMVDDMVADINDKQRISSHD